VVAGWCRYAEGIDESGNRYPIEDDMRVIVQEKAIASRVDPLSFLNIEPVFGDLLNSQKFTEAYLNALHGLYQKGTIACMEEIINK
jgi:mannitol 2-dehydrogenase